MSDNDWLPSSPGAEPDLARILLERSPSGVIVTKPNGQLFIVNPAVHAMLPIVPDPVGRRPLEAVPVDELAEALNPERTDEVEFTLDSGNRTLLVTVVSLNPEGGRLAIIQDVTRLAAAESYRKEFVANVSHELRTPATSIAGYAETLLEEVDSMDPEIGNMVKTIHRNAQRLIDLFDDLLHLSRIDAHEGELPLQAIQLANVVREAIDKARVRAEERHITFDNLVDDSLVVSTHRDALGHVFGNLVENAVKYSFEGGHISVRATPREQGRILVEVIDVGMGIEPSHHKRIFERFFRVDKGRSRAAGGTGLGLAIVKRLCTAIGASVDVKSRPGKGSVFRVLLPGASDQAKMR